MKYFIPILLLLASCSASHKIKKSEKRVLDSTSTVTTDTTRVTNEETSSSNMEAQDVHIRIDYNQPTRTPADSALDQAKSRPVDRKPVKTGNKFVDLIRKYAGAIENNPGISSIRIDIGKISDSSSTSFRKDSGAGKTESTTAVHKEEKSSLKEVWRPYLWPAIWILLFLVLLYVAYRKRGDLKKIILKIFKL